MRQQRLMVRVFLIIISAGLAVALCLSLAPGSYWNYWNNLLLLAAMAVLALVLATIALLTLVFIVDKLVRRQGRLSDLPLREAAAVALFAVATAGMLVFDVPLRVAFALSRSAFDEACKSAPSSRQELNSRLGLYHVDEYATDSRGGVYFRVNTAVDVIDLISFGFVYQPNREGTPFGAAHYELSRLVDDWYLFSVSSDFY